MRAAAILVLTVLFAARAIAAEPTITIDRSTAMARDLADVVAGRVTAILPMQALAQGSPQTTLVDRAYALAQVQTGGRFADMTGEAAGRQEVAAILDAGRGGYGLAQVIDIPGQGQVCLALVDIAHDGGDWAAAISGGAITPSLAMRSSDLLRADLSRLAANHEAYGHCGDAAYGRTAALSDSAQRLRVEGRADIAMALEAALSDGSTAQPSLMADLREAARRPLEAEYVGLGNAGVAYDTAAGMRAAIAFADDLLAAGGMAHLTQRDIARLADDLAGRLYGDAELTTCFETRVNAARARALDAGYRFDDLSQPAAAIRLPSGSMDADVVRWLDEADLSRRHAIATLAALSETRPKPSSKLLAVVVATP